MKLFESVKRPVLKSVLMSVFFVVFLAGCGGGGGGGGTPPPSMKGQALLPPGNGPSATLVVSKALPGSAAFANATVIARSLSTGNTYQASTTVDENGNFTIENTPYDDDYLVIAKKGNIVLLKFVSISNNAARPFELGEVDASSTAHAIMLSNLIDGQFPQDIDLRENIPGDVSVDDLLALLRAALIDQPEIEIRDLVNIVINEAGELRGDAETLNENFRDNDDNINPDNIARINIYLSIQQIINEGDADNGSGDTIKDWLENKDITVNTTTITYNFTNITVNNNFTANNVYFEDQLNNVQKTETVISSGPSNPTENEAATFSFFADPPDATFECALDDETPSECTSPVNYTALSIGSHTFCVIATDPTTGIIDPTPACYTWVISSDLDTGLIAYYPFNGNANDESGNEHHGTVNGAATTNENLFIGDNASDYLSLPNTVVDGLNDFTLSANVKINTLHLSGNLPDNFLISGARSAEDNALSLYYKGNQNEWRFRINDQLYTFDDNIIEDENTHHLALIRNGSTARLFIDGSEIGNGKTVIASTISVDPGGLIIGQDQDSLGGTFARNQSWAGLVDNLRIYNRALSDTEISELATQQPNPILSVTLAGSGTGVVTSDIAGINCESDCDEAYASGTSVTLSATPAMGSVFVAWGGVCSGSGACVLNMDANKTVTATFDTAPPDTFPLDVTIDPSGTGDGSVTGTNIDCPGDCNEIYTEGTSITLTPNPATGSVFVTWSGDCTGSGDCTVTMNASQSVTAKFDVIQHNLNVSLDAAGTGNGTVTATGISCPGDCDELYNQGTDLTLTATPDGSSVFVAWGGACTGSAGCTVTMSTVQSVTAKFDATPTTTFKLDVFMDAAGTGTGTVTSVPTGIDCGSDCTEDYNQGTPVTLTATPDSGSVFSGWIGDCSGLGNCDLTMDSEQSATAKFDVTTVEILFSEDFETSAFDWTISFGMWEFGLPTAGPSTCFTGVQCAGTILNGNYGADIDSRLESPSGARRIVLPTVSGAEEIHLRFQNWFSYSAGDSGQVQVAVLDPDSGTFGAWENVGGTVSDVSINWTLKDVDLTIYAGKTIQISFLHTAVNVCCGNSIDVSSGWYIDDVEVVKKAPVFTGDFEAGALDWVASFGMWEVGLPTAGPASCFNGTQCAGTILNGNYGANIDSRFISAPTIVQTVTGNEEIHLRFQNWFSYSAGDSGRVQISVFDPVTQTWGSWVNEGGAIFDVSINWTLKDVDLTAYAGKTIRISFLHTAVNVCCGNSIDVSSGWYIDDVEVVKKAPVFTGDFEAGALDWVASFGMWEVGLPTAGPASCFNGTQCAGTILNGNYGANIDSRFISAPTIVQTVTGNEEIHLRFQNWFSYSAGDSGRVQISVFDPVTQTWGAWMNEGGAVSNVSINWTLKDVNLTAYAGKTIRIGFLHTAENVCCGNSIDVSSGWYIDDIVISKF